MGKAKDYPGPYRWSTFGPVAFSMSSVGLGIVPMINSSGRSGNSWIPSQLSTRKMVIPSSSHAGLIFSEWMSNQRLAVAQFRCLHPEEPCVRSTRQHCERRPP